MIIQAAKIIGTGLATTGLRGAGVGIGFKCASNLGKYSDFKYTLSIVKGFSTTCTLLIDNSQVQDQDKANNDSKIEAKKKPLETLFDTLLSGTEEEKRNAMESGKDSASDFKSSDVSTWNWKQARSYFQNNNVSSEKQEEIFDYLYKNLWNTASNKRSRIIFQAEMMHEAHVGSDKSIVRNSDRFKALQDEEVKAIKDFKNDSNALKLAKEAIMIPDSSTSISTEENEGNNRQSPIDYLVEKQETEPMDIDDPDG